MKKTNKKGFTLVELLVVIVIVGVLAAVIVPNVTSSIEKAEKSAAEQDAMSAYKSLVASLDLSKNTLPEKFFYYTEKYVVLLRNGSLDKDFNSIRTESTFTPKFLDWNEAINGVLAENNDFVMLDDGSILIYLTDYNWRATIFANGIIWDAYGHNTYYANQFRTKYINEKAGGTAPVNFIMCNGIFTESLDADGKKNYGGSYYFDAEQLEITEDYLDGDVTKLYNGIAYDYVKISTPYGSILCLYNKTTGVYDIYEVVYQDVDNPDNGLKWEKLSYSFSD